MRTDQMWGILHGFPFVIQRLLIVSAHMVRG